MPNNRFDAQTLLETGRRQATQTVELTFEDSKGEHLTVSLPARVAADMLVPVLSQFQAENPYPSGGPQFHQNATKWQVGSLDAEPKVAFQLNDDSPYAMGVRDAKGFWRAIREEIELIERRPNPTRQ